MTIWLVTDRHLHHKTMVANQHRPYGYEEIIRSNWLERVAPEDTVIDMGDVILGRNAELAAINAELPGTKIHLRGNHDKRYDWMERQGYVISMDYFVRNGVCISHKPILPLPPGVKVNIHGHFHKSAHRSSLFDMSTYYRKHRHRYLLLEIESTLAPVALESVVRTGALEGKKPLVPIMDPDERYGSDEKVLASIKATWSPGEVDGERPDQWLLGPGAMLDTE